LFCSGVCAEKAKVFFLTLNLEIVQFNSKTAAHATYTVCSIFVWIVIEMQWLLSLGLQSGIIEPIGYELLIDIRSTQYYASGHS